MNGDWAAAYVGKKWDETENHCWAFCRYVWWQEFRLRVPELDVNALSPRDTRRHFSDHDEYARWEPVETPVNGDAVIMAQGRRPCHIGIWVDPGRVLHSVKGIGSVCVPHHRLRDQGYRVTGCFRRLV